MFGAGFGSIDQDLLWNDTGSRLLRLHADRLGTTLAEYTALVLRQPDMADPETVAAAERLTEAAALYEALHVGFTGEPLHRPIPWSDEAEPDEELDSVVIPPDDEIPLVLPWAAAVLSTEEGTVATTHVERFGTGCTLHIRQLLVRGDRSRQEWDNLLMSSGLRVHDGEDDLIQAGGSGAGGSKRFAADHAFWAPEGTDLTSLALVIPGAGSFPLPEVPVR